MVATFLLAACSSVYAQTAIVDPMRPPNASAVSSGSTSARNKGWLVSQILISPGRRLAVVNGRVVNVGNVVNGATVSAIYGNAVELRLNGNAVLLEPIFVDIKQQPKR
jgi:MSHA biogenesis protein MshK